MDILNEECIRDGEWRGRRHFVGQIAQTYPGDILATPKIRITQAGEALPSRSCTTLVMFCIGARTPRLGSRGTSTSYPLS